MQTIDKLKPEAITAMVELKSSLMSGHERDTEYKRGLILKYIQEHEGEIIRMKEFEEIAGYSGGSASPAITSLLKERRIIRERRKSKKSVAYAYFIGNLQSRGTKPGPVLVTTPPPTEKMPDPLAATTTIDRVYTLEALELGAYKFLRNMDIDTPDLKRGEIAGVLIDFVEFIEKI